MLFCVFLYFFTAAVGGEERAIFWQKCLKNCFFALRRRRKVFIIHFDELKR